MEPAENPAFVYLLLCKGNRFYIGFTFDLKQRWLQHQGLSPGGARFTRGFPPVKMAAAWQVHSGEHSARSLEQYLKKRLSPEQKKQLAQNPELLTTILPKILPEAVQFNIEVLTDLPA
jgi:putative endonuclease